MSKHIMVKKSTQNKRVTQPHLAISCVALLCMLAIIWALNCGESFSEKVYNKYATNKESMVQIDNENYVETPDNEIFSSINWNINSLNKTVTRTYYITDEYRAFAHMWLENFEFCDDMSYRTSGKKINFKSVIMFEDQLLYVEKNGKVTYEYMKLDYFEEN